MKVDQETFIQRYQEVIGKGGSINSLAKEFGMSRQSVYLRAKRLRNKGHDLPEVPGNFKDVPKDKLRKISYKGGKASHAGGFNDPEVVKKALNKRWKKDEKQKT